MSSSEFVSPWGLSGRRTKNVPPFYFFPSVFCPLLQSTLRPPLPSLALRSDAFDVVISTRYILVYHILFVSFSGMKAKKKKKKKKCWSCTSSVRLFGGKKEGCAESKADMG